MLRIRDAYPRSRILIFTHPGSQIPDLGSRIPDPKTATKGRGEKNWYHTYFVVTNLTKLNIILLLFYYPQHCLPPCATLLISSSGALLYVSQPYVGRSIQGASGIVAHFLTQK